MPKVVFGPTITDLGEFNFPAEATVQAMVEAGQYNFVHPAVNSETFLIADRGPRRLFVVDFKKEMETKKVEAEIAAMGNRKAATMQDVLLVGANAAKLNWPEFWRLAGLGLPVSVRGYRCVPYLFGTRKEHGLDLHYYGTRWRDCFSFLVVECPFPSASRQSAVCPRQV